MLKTRFWRNFDWILMGVTLILAIIGILVLYSITAGADGDQVTLNASNQIIFAVFGLAALLGTAFIDYRIWIKFTTWLYLVMLALLAFVLIAGKSALGATRWINLGFFQFQPSELAKLVLIIVMAKFLADHYEDINKPKYFILSILYVFVPVAMVLAQPDLGTALVLIVIWLTMVLMSKIRKLYLVGLAAGSLALLPTLVGFLKPYQRQRLETFFNPSADPLTTGYNVVQSTIAVGSGQWFGRGLGAGSQSQLNFLPSQHTDFIFAVLAEKMGFVGSMLLLALFGVLFWRAIVVAWRAQDRFGMFLAIGITAMLLFHVFINVGMNMGIMPVTGIPLPFISYGGTSLLIGFAAIGLLQSVAVRRKKIEFES